MFIVDFWNKLFLIINLNTKVYLLKMYATDLYSLTVSSGVVDHIPVLLLSDVLTPSQSVSRSALDRCSLTAHVACSVVSLVGSPGGSHLTYYV